MAYGFNKPKTEACAVSGGKHKWTFVKNATRTRSVGGPLGSGFHISAVGIYRCVCSKQRYGAVRHNEPGADIREHKEPTP